MWPNVCPRDRYHQNKLREIARNAVQFGVLGDVMLPFPHALESGVQRSSRAEERSL
jgi:hypothetical protein